MLEAIGSGKIHYISRQPKSTHVRLIGDAAVRNGEYLVRVTDRRVQPEPFEVNIFNLVRLRKTRRPLATNRLAIHPECCAAAAPGNPLEQAAS